MNKKKAVGIAINQCGFSGCRVRSSVKTGRATGTSPVTGLVPVARPVLLGVLGRMVDIALLSDDRRLTFVLAG